MIFKMLGSSQAAGTSAENQEIFVFSPFQPKGTETHIPQDRNHTHQQAIVQEVWRWGCPWEREKDREQFMEKKNNH